jgi:hypothetical protein
MNIITTFIVILFALTSSVTACSKEEYAAKFGEVYTLHGMTPHNAPFVKDQQIVAEVTYQTKCSNGGSLFTATNIDKGQPADVAFIILSRGEPSCSTKLETSISYNAQVTVSLPSNVSRSEDGQWFLAFPPDGDYELYLLKSKKLPRNIVDKTFEVKAPSQETEETVMTEDVIATNINQTGGDREEDLVGHTHKLADEASIFQVFAGTSESIKRAFRL